MAGNEPFPQTSPTLLGRLREGGSDDAAWRLFVDSYGPRIRGWCLRWKLQDADADDATQEVLARLARKLRTFAYDPQKSFRGWLRRVTDNVLCDFLADRQRLDHASGDSGILRVLNSVEARADLAVQLAEQFDRELLEEAMTRVQLRVEPQTWRAFQLTALEGVSGQAAAEQLGQRLTAVFKARSRVQQLLRDEIARLEGEGE